MPKVNTPEIGKGFWVTIGVILALLILSLLTSLWARARKKA